MNEYPAGASQPIPIFIISYNRGTMMEAVIASYRRLSRPVAIIVHDNGSTDPETLRVLATLEADGTKIVRAPQIGHPDELNRVNETVSAHFAETGTCGRYVVTDCDVDMSIAHADALDVYDGLLDAFPHAACVGPMLRISDIPVEYPLYNRVMNRHIEQFWHREPLWVETSFGTVAYQEAPIDTTFAMHRAGEAFTRMKLGLRVYEPYEARHLDWYLTSCDDGYHVTSNATISHWNNVEEYGRYRDEPLGSKEFTAVATANNGDLVALRRQPLSVGAK